MVLFYGLFICWYGVVLLGFVALRYLRSGELRGCGLAVIPLFWVVCCCVFAVLGGLLLIL